jgi:hypothetical protein
MNQKVRVGLLAVASLVLVFTALPAVASGSGIRASSASGTVTGTVKVAKAPSSFQPAYLGAGACPDTGPAGQMCANPQYTLSGAGGAYTLTLGTGTYRVAGFYENSGFGGAFLGPTHVVSITAGGTVALNLWVPYRAPAAITGTITITGVPKSVSVSQLEVVLCPSFAPYTGGSIPLACVSTYTQPSTTGANTGTYSLSGLPPGAWMAYAGFCTQSSCGTPDPNTGTAVTLVAGQTSTLNLTGKFLQPGQAFVSGTVSVTGAPAGFSAPLGVSACPQSGTLPCQVIYYVSGGLYGLILSAGTWTVKGFYLAAPYDNAIDGPAVTVTVGSGHYATRDLAVPYQVLGTATGSITITGLPAGAHITDYVLLACPSSEPWGGGIAVPAPECVSEYSGPGGFGYGPADRNQVKTTNPGEKPPAGYAGPAQAAATFNLYSVPTLTAGTWLLYPGYEDVFGTVLDSTPTSVNIVSAGTTTRHLTVAYESPTAGAVTGTVDVVGAPAGGNQAGAQACTALPTGSTCPGEQDAYAQAGGAYSLVLAPGTWWVRGFVDVPGTSGLTQSTSSPVEVHLSAGQDAKENFVVTY